MSVCGLCGEELPADSKVCKKCARQMSSSTKSSKPLVKSKGMRIREAIPKILKVLADGLWYTDKGIAQKANQTPLTIREALKELKRRGTVKHKRPNLWSLTERPEESVADIDTSLSAILDGSTVVDQVERLLR